MRIKHISWPATIFAGLLTLLSLAPARPADAATWTRWRAADMRHCGGKQPYVTFDGVKSVVTVSKDHYCVLYHSLAYADLSKDTFVVTFGKVSPWVSWDVRIKPSDGCDEWRKMLTGREAARTGCLYRA